MKNRNAVNTGIPGSGKSYGLVGNIVADAQVKKQGIIFFDFHGSTIDLLLSHLFAKGLGNRVILDDLARTDRVLRRKYLVCRNDVTDPLKRAMLNNQIMQEMKYAFGNRRAMDAWEQKPFTEIGFEMGFRILQGQRSDVPFEAVLDLYMMGPQYEKLLRNCTDEKAVEFFRSKEKLNATQCSNELGPAYRIFQGVIKSPVWRARLGGDFSYKQAMIEKKIVLIKGGGEGVTDDDSKTTFNMDMIQVIMDVRAYFAETGKPLLTDVYSEEAQHAGTLTPLVLGSLEQDRKRGLKHEFVFQHLPKDDRLDVLMSGCAIHRAYRQGSSDQARIIAEDFLQAIDHYREHHRTERQVHDGYEEFDDTTKTYGETEDHHKKKKKSSSTSHKKGHRAKFREVSDVHYMPLEDQIKELQQKLMSLPTGTRMVRDADGVRIEQIPKMEEAWALGNTFLPSKKMTLAQSRLQQAIERLYHSPIYSPPNLWKHDQPQPNPELLPISPPASEQAPTSTAPTMRKDGGGMRRSSG